MRRVGLVQKSNRGSTSEFFLMYIEMIKDYRWPGDLYCYRFSCPKRGAFWPAAIRGEGGPKITKTRIITPLIMAM